MPAVELAGAAESLPALVVPGVPLELLEQIRRNDEMFGGSRFGHFRMLPVTERHHALV
jgi:hypothetical protein